MNNAEVELKSDRTLSVSDLGTIVNDALRGLRSFVAHATTSFANSWLSYYGSRVPSREEMKHIYLKASSAARNAGTKVVDGIEETYLAAFRMLGIRYDDDRLIQESGPSQVIAKAPRKPDIEKLASEDPILKGIVEDPRWDRDLKPWEREALVREAMSLLRYSWLGSVASRGTKLYARVNFPQCTYTSLNGTVPENFAAVMWVAKIRDMHQY